MTPNTENKQKAHFELEDAMQTYPITPAPAGFSRVVMKNVRAFTPLPRFRLSWIDYALTFFITSMTGLVLILLQLIPTKWIMLVRFQAFVLWERSIHFPFTPIFFVGCVLILVTISFAMILFKRPRMILIPQRLI